MLETVAIILPAKDEEDFISACLESILSQSYKPRSVMIVLDKCTDNTPEIAKAYAKKCNIINVKEMPWSKYDGRLYRAHRIAELDNQGIINSEKQSDFIMIVNADTVYSKNYIEEAMKIMEENPDCAITGWLLGGTISGSGIVYRKSFIDKATNGLIKECANEELYMQLKAISIGYKVMELTQVTAKLLRSTGQSDYSGMMLDSIRDGYASYAFGFSPFYVLSRIALALLQGKILTVISIPLGYTFAVFIRAPKYDLAETNAPLQLQRKKISRMLKLHKY